MDFSYSTPDLAAAYQTTFIALGFIAGIGGTAWVVTWALLRPSRRSTLSWVGMLGVCSLITTGMITVGVLQIVHLKDKEEATATIIPDQIREVYGLEVSEEAVEALRTYMYPDDEPGYPSGWLYQEEYNEERAPDSVARYGITSVLVDGGVVEAQLVWAQGWRLLNTATDEELPHK